MNLPKIIFLFLILFAAIQVSVSQKNPEPLLIDRFSGGSCDNFRSRFDNLLLDVYNEPNSKAYIILYSENNLSEQVFSYLDQITGYIPFRKFPADRLTIVRAQKEGEAQVEFWKVPAGAKDPSPSGDLWTYKLDGLEKNFLFGNLFSEACFTFTPEVYAGFLLANADVTGNIVVYDKTLKERRKEGNRWLKTLTEEHKIPRNKLRVFYRKAKSFGGGFGRYSDVEFWLAAPRKTRSGKVLQ